MQPTDDVAGPLQPVLPAADNGLPFRPVEFDKMTATAYIDENGNFSRIAWSLRAAEVRPPAKGAKPGVDKAAA